MKEPTYREALRASWKFAWHHKHLWIFGLFAAFLGQMGIVEFLSKAVVSIRSLNAPSLFVYTWNVFSKFSFQELRQTFNLPIDEWVWVVWLAVLFVGGILLALFVSVASQGTIVHNAVKYIKQRDKNKFPDTAKSWHESRVHFWRLLGLNVLRKVLIIGLSIFIGWSTWRIFLTVNPGDVFWFIILFAGAILIGMVSSLWLIYAVGYVVVENYSLLKAMGKAWKLFQDHVLVSLEVGFILIILNVFLAGVAVLGVSCFVILHFLFIIFSLLFNLPVLYTIGMVLGLLLLGVFIVFIGSVFSVFATSMWTFLFTKMHKEGIVSRILHFFKKK